jgi:membrane-associated phospholipid phosphatase
MQTSSLRSARDYNRGLIAPVRWMHMGAAAVVPRWLVGSRGETIWLPPLLIGVILALIALPFDGAIARFFAAHPPEGDLKREIEALQQYGQGVSSALVAIIIWLQDPPRRRALWTWIAALLVAFVVVFGIKTMLGRPRPEFDDPWTFLSPLGQYPIGAGKGIYHAWEIWRGISAKLWSMPSSHTAYAFVMAAFLGAIYPRLRVLVYALAAFVGLARVIVHGHYPSDVFVGAGLGLAIGWAAVAGDWGSRLVRLPSGAGPTPA